jgi:predicted TIM-barrel fold metal-dependent hydrolase
MADPRTIDVHAHFLPPVYRQALADTGLKTLDGGMPVPDWSPERALGIMDEVGIGVAVLSVSSPHVSFLNPMKAVTLCRTVNDAAAEMRRRHAGRFGAFAILPLPDVAASLVELERALIQAFARFFYDTALSVMPQQIAALRALVPISQIVYGTGHPHRTLDDVRQGLGLRQERGMASGQRPGLRPDPFGHRPLARGR